VPIDAPVRVGGSTYSKEPFPKQIHELREAIRIEPGYTHARQELHRLLGMLN